jgi:hypothetical protein
MGTCIKLFLHSVILLKYDFLKTDLLPSSEENVNKNMKVLCWVHYTELFFLAINSKFCRLLVQVKRPFFLNTSAVAKSKL